MAQGREWSFDWIEGAASPDPRDRLTPAAHRAAKAVCLVLSTLDGPGDVDSRGDVEFAEDVPQMRFDGLGAEEECFGDLWVRSAIDDESGNLLLTLG